VVLKEEAAALGSGQEGQMGEKVRKVRFGCAASQSRDANAMQLRAMPGRASGGLFFRSVLGSLPVVVLERGGDWHRYCERRSEISTKELCEAVQSGQS
jgi:hypothetical protein